MLTLYALRFTAYLLMGCFTMLGLNQLTPITRKQFVLGMLVWWVLVLVWIAHIGRAYAKRWTT